MGNNFKTTAPIKLVVWDMDDTFWEGTLSEGEIRLVDRNIEIVKILADRGIMSSISSKNDFEPVKQTLIDAGLWDYFVFPHISWSPKSGALQSILDQANLRADNTLFIDDNLNNLEEVLFRFPKMMVAHPDNVLAGLLNFEHATGKDDRNHSRLKQYKQLEKKVADQTHSSLNNEDFLRQCNITIRREFDIEVHLDRIIELINRSNQLNFTKIRLETDEAIAEFKKHIERHDVFAAAIFVSDRYGDHGLIGFYMLVKNERINKLLHFVWSCRLVNTGLEQYVYELLNEPIVNIVEPVSNPIKSFEKIDWIREGTEISNENEQVFNHKLLLIGSCDLTAVASYCSSNRKEYVNGVNNGVMTRYDDFGFILGDPDRVEASDILETIPAWDKQSFTSFQRDLSASDVLIISLSTAMRGEHILTDDGVLIRLNPGGLGDYIDANPYSQFMKRGKFYYLNAEQKGRLLKMALQSLHERSQGAVNRFLLEANTRNITGVLSQENYELLVLYNSICEEFCKNTQGWHLVPINEIVTSDKITDEDHYSRIAYLEIAQYINERTTVNENPNITKPAAPSRHVNDGFYELIKSGKVLSRFSLFGSKRGKVQHIKRLVKLTPLYKVLLKTVIKRKKDSLLD